MPVRRTYTSLSAIDSHVVMLDKAQLTELFDRHGTPSAGRQLILDARIQAPVRAVQSRGGNVITVLNSRKMGREITTESRHIEFPAAIGMEYDDRVLEYYPQPCERKFEFTDAATGEIHSHRHIPDFLTIRDDGFTLEEWKSEAFQRGLRESGEREQTYILFNRDFLIATCPPVDRKGTRDVNRQRGVKVGDRFYWSEVFRSSSVAGGTFPVRYDPWDASSVYVWVNDQWHQAVCRALLGLGQLTDVEQKLVSQEFLRRTKTKEADPQARQRLREFLQVFTPEGATAMELERQAENKSLYDSLQLASVTPVPLSPRLSLTEEISSAADVPAEPSSTTTNPSTPLHEATGLDDPFDFDDF